MRSTTTEFKNKFSTSNVNACDVGVDRRSGAALEPRVSVLLVILHIRSLHIRTQVHSLAARQRCIQ